MANFAVFVTVHSDSSNYTGWVEIQAETAVLAIESIEKMTTHIDAWERPQAEFAVLMHLAMHILDANGKPPDVSVAEIAFNVPNYDSTDKILTW